MSKPGSARAARPTSKRSAPRPSRDRKRPEPSILLRGKRFHKRVQRDWQRTAQGAVRVEHGILVLSRHEGRLRQRRGRLDLFVGDIGDLVAVVEIKSTSWERIKPANRKSLLASHSRQVWRYVDRYLDADRIAVCPGIIYPRPPRDLALRVQVETYLNDRGLQVTWYNP